MPSYSLLKFLKTALKYKSKNECQSFILNTVIPKLISMMSNISHQTLLK